MGLIYFKKEKPGTKGLSLSPPNVNAHVRSVEQNPTSKANFILCCRWNELLGLWMVLNAEFLRMLLTRKVPRVSGEHRKTLESVSGNLPSTVQTILYCGISQKWIITIKRNNSLLTFPAVPIVLDFVTDFTSSRLLYLVQNSLPSKHGLQKAYFSFS